MNAPLYLARSGDINGGSFYNAGSYSFYWSSTISNSERARYVVFNFENVVPESSNYRYTGFNLRCVLRES